MLNNCIPKRRNSLDSTKAPSSTNPALAFALRRAAGGQHLQEHPWTHVQPHVHPVHTSPLLASTARSFLAATFRRGAASSRFSSPSRLCWQLLRAERAHGEPEDESKAESLGGPFQMHYLLRIMEVIFSVWLKPSHGGAQLI